LYGRGKVAEESLAARQIWGRGKKNIFLFCRIARRRVVVGGRREAILLLDAKERVSNGRKTLQKREGRIRRRKREGASTLKWERRDRTGLRYQGIFVWRQSGRRNPQKRRRH